MGTPLRGHRWETPWGPQFGDHFEGNALEDNRWGNPLADLFRGHKMGIPLREHIGGPILGDHAWTTTPVGQPLWGHTRGNTPGGPLLGEYHGENNWGTTAANHIWKHPLGDTNWWTQLGGHP